MNRYKLLKNGIVFSALLGFSTIFYGAFSLTDPKRTDKVERYYRAEQITKTLDNAVEQSHNINFGLDDLKMRESLSDVYEISNQHFNQLSKDKEVKEYLSLKDKKMANANNIMFGGIGLLGLALISTVGLTLYDQTKENSIQRTKLDSYQN